MVLLECLSILSVCAFTGAGIPESGTHGHYAVLTGKVHTPPPFETVDIVYGPHEQNAIWWQLSARD